MVHQKTYRNTLYRVRQKDRVTYECGQLSNV